MVVYQRKYDIVHHLKKGDIVVSDNFRGSFPTGITIGIIAIILISPVQGQSYNNTQPFSKDPKLDSLLSQLINSPDMSGFAQAHNLYMQDGRIRVVVEIVNETALLPDYVLEETRYKTKIQALVPVEKIAELSGETNVTFIEAPLKPYADTSAPGAASTPKSGFNSGVLIIFSMILIFFIKKIRMW